MVSAAIDLPEVTTCAIPVAPASGGRQHVRMRERLKLLLQPLNLAGILTWVAVLLAMHGEPGGLNNLRLGLLLVFLIAFLIPDQPGIGRRLQDALLWLQLMVAVLMIEVAPRTGTAPVLLVVVAAQLPMAWRPRNALMVLAAANLVFLLLTIRAGNDDAWLHVTVYAGFQAFAAMIGHYARSAENARDRLAMVNADLLATRALLADSARDAERLRVARELHDVAGHKLTAMKLNLRALAADPALAGRPQVRLSEQLASELLEDIRNVVQALRDSRGLDLETALRALAAPLPQLRMQLSIDEDAVIRDPQLAETVLRIVQEAMTNAARHAGAATLWVELRREGSRLWLRVADDGQAPALLREGNGLAGIRERVAAVDGDLRIGRGVAGNLELTVEFPS